MVLTSTSMIARSMVIVLVVPQLHRNWPRTRKRPVQAMMRVDRLVQMLQSLDRNLRSKARTGECIGKWNLMRSLKFCNPWYPTTNNWSKFHQQRVRKESRQEPLLWWKPTMNRSLHYSHATGKCFLHWGTQVEVVELMADRLWASGIPRIDEIAGR